MRLVFVDTGGFYAALNRKDRFHSQAAALFAEAVDQEWKLLTSNFVLAETHALILTRLGQDFAAAWLRNIPVLISRVSADDERKAVAIILRHRDKSFSYCDAVSFSLMERLRIRAAISFDRHFAQYGGFEVLKPSKS